MTIGIDASRAFLEKRTGIEEYSFQVIKHLAKIMKDRQVILYVKKNQKVELDEVALPDKWKIKVIKFPILWTQIGLSLEMFFRPVSTLFVPAHTVPFVHPARNAFYVLIIKLNNFFNKFFLGKKNENSDAGGPKNTIVTIHGLEYEFVSRAYSFLERLYMRFFIKNSCRWAKKIISVSENTKKDLMKLYNVPEEKIEVVYEGFSTNYEYDMNVRIIQNTKYLLFIGRIEERKNIAGILEAFEILKEKYQIPQQLFLAGKPGYGYEKIKIKLKNSKFRKDIVEKGFVSDEEKFELLRGAEAFLFPSFYEGFGLPILEAQSVGTPVVSSNVSSIPEVAGNSALLVDPKNPAEIAEAVQKLLSDKNLKDDIIEKGRENVKRFSWEKCAENIAKLLNG